MNGIEYEREIVSMGRLYITYTFDVRGTDVMRYNVNGCTYVRMHVCTFTCTCTGNIILTSF